MNILFALLICINSFAGEDPKDNFFGHDPGGGGDHRQLPTIPFPLKANLLKGINLYSQILMSKDALPHSFKMALKTEMDQLAKDINKNFRLVPSLTHFVVDLKNEGDKNGTVDGSTLRTLLEPGAPIYFSSIWREKTPDQIVKALSFELLRHVLPQEFRGNTNIVGTISAVVISSHFSDEAPASSKVDSALRFLHRYYGFDPEILNVVSKGHRVRDIITCKNNNPGGTPDVLALRMIREMQGLTSNRAQSYIKDGANINYALVYDDKRVTDSHSYYYGSHRIPRRVCYSVLSFALHYKKWDIIKLLVGEKHLNPNFYNLPDNPEILQYQEALIPFVFKDVPQDTVLTRLQRENSEIGNLLLRHPHTLKDYIISDSKKPEWIDPYYTLRDEECDRYESGYYLPSSPMRNACTGLRSYGVALSYYFDQNTVHEFGRKMGHLHKVWRNFVNDQIYEYEEFLHWILDRPVTLPDEQAKLKLVFSGSGSCRADFTRLYRITIENWKNINGNPFVEYTPEQVQRASEILRLVSQRRDECAFQ